MNKAANCALVLIALAMAGAGVSYHFTLESRFAALDQKLEQNAVALQQCEITQETAASSKADALANLSKEVDTLQTSLASLAPLGKATQDQTASLAEIRKQIAAIQQAQDSQQETQKKIADYAGQLQQIKHDVAVQAVKSTPAANVVLAPAPVAEKPAAPKPMPVVEKPAPTPAPIVEKPAPAAKPVAATPGPIAPVPANPVEMPPAPVAYPVALPVVAPRASAVEAPVALPVTPRADNAVDIRPDESVRTTGVTVRVVPIAGVALQDR